MCLCLAAAAAILKGRGLQPIGYAPIQYAAVYSGMQAHRRLLSDAGSMVVRHAHKGVGRALLQIASGPTAASNVSAWLLDLGRVVPVAAIKAVLDATYDGFFLQYSGVQVRLPAASGRGGLLGMGPLEVRCVWIGPLQLGQVFGLQGGSCRFKLQFDALLRLRVPQISVTNSSSGSGGVYCAFDAAISLITGVADFVCPASATGRYVYATRSVNYSLPLQDLQVTVVEGGEVPAARPCHGPMMTTAPHLCTCGMHAQPIRQ